MFENPSSGVPFRQARKLIREDPGWVMMWMENSAGFLTESNRLGENKKIVYNNLVDANIATATSKWNNL